MVRQSKAAFRASNLEQNIVHEHMGAKKTKRPCSPCCINVHSRRYRLVDADGISAKAAIDGLVICGLLQDDSTEYVKEVSYSQEKIEKNELEETILTITWTK